MDPKKTVEELVEEFSATTDKLGSALGTADEEVVAQRIADAVGGLIMLDATKELDELGVHTSLRQYYVHSGPDDTELRVALERRDEDAVRALLLARGNIPPEMVDQIVESFRTQDRD